MFVAKVLSLSLAIVALTPSSVHSQQLPLRQTDHIIAQQDQRVSEKEQKLITSDEEVRELQAKKKALSEQIENEKKTADELRKKIADKKAAEAKAAETARAAQVTVAIASNPRSTCGDNQYAAYIYGMESGGRIPGNCNPTAKNAEGCIGIGQACPASKLIAVCPNLDYECQNAFFTSYALSRYGGWAGAYAFWVAHNYW